MKLRRSLSWIASASWFIPLAVVMILWVRSYYRLDELSRVGEDNRPQALVLFRGSLHIILGGKSAAQRPASWDSFDIPGGSTPNNLYPIGTYEWQRLGFAKVTAVSPFARWQRAQTPAVGEPVMRITAPPASLPVTRPASRPSTRPRPPRSLVPWLMVPPFEAWLVPYWALAVLCSLPPVWRGSLLARGLIRKRRGRCVACGYDLRASPDRCPECGQTS